MNTTIQPLVQKWTGPTNKSGKFHMAEMGNIIMKVQH